MSADFPLKSDLPLADQQEIDRTLAIDESRRTASEQAFLDAREIYLTNEVLTVSLKKGDRGPNATAASAQLTFDDIPTDGELVNIGGDVYEFDDDTSVTGDNIAVDISAASVPDDVATALADAIQSSGTVTQSGNAQGNIVEVSADELGPVGNEIAVSTTCADANWSDDTLTGGRNSVLANQGEFYLASLNSDLYFAVEDINDNETAWSQLTFD